MAMGTSTEMLPVHGKWTVNVSTLSGTSPLAGIFNWGGNSAPWCVSYSIDSTYDSCDRCKEEKKYIKFCKM